MTSQGRDGPGRARYGADRSGKDGHVMVRQGKGITSLELAELRKRRAARSRVRILARGLALPSTVIKAEAKQRHPAKGNAS